MREELVATYGEFSLDAAACADSTLAPEWLGPTHDNAERRDALAFDHWANLVPVDGHAFLNPPYGRGIDQWLARCVTTAMKGVRVVTLIPASVDAGWWWRYVQDEPLATATFWRGRIKFVGPHSEGGSPTFPSAVVVYDPA